MSDTKKHYNLIIRGRVQGVWYRGWTLEKARQLGIKGYAQNLPDGSVFIEAEGNEQNLGTFIAMCRRGPQMAVVESVEIEDGTLKDFLFFEIKH